MLVQTYNIFSDRFAPPIHTSTDPADLLRVKGNFTLLKEKPRFFFFSFSVFSPPLLEGGREGEREVTYANKCQLENYT